MTAAVVQLSTEFTTLTGRRPDGVWSAPGRVNLIGEHTDYCDGYVLPFALPRRTRVAVGVRRDNRLRMRSLQRPGETREVDVTDVDTGGSLGWAAYPAGAVWALRDAGVDVPGLDIVVDSDVAIGAGLSSSAALICATLLAAASIAHHPADPMQLACLGQHAENVVAGVPCGVMDHAVSLLAREAHALFLDVRTLRYEHVPLRPEEADLALVVIDTNVRHQLGDGGYADRRRTTELVARTLGVKALRDVGVDELDAAMLNLDDPVHRRRLRHVVTENQRVLDAVSRARAGSFRDLGPLLTASHQSLRDDYEVSVPALDDAVAAALRAGAVGARMTGGGFGGSVIALVPTGQQTAVTDAVARAARAAGHPVPAVSVVHPSVGAHRDEGSG